MMAAAERAPWQNPRILTTLTLVFLAGAAAGALSMQFGLHDRIHRGTVVPSGGSHTVAGGANATPHQPGHDAVLNRFQTELGLTSPQTEKLALVLDDYSQYYESLQEQLDDLRSTGKTRILEILDQDQRVKFEKMMNDLAPQLTPPPAPAASKPAAK
jgi:hypothetical protein